MIVCKCIQISKIYQILYKVDLHVDLILSDCHEVVSWGLRDTVGQLEAVELEDLTHRPFRMVTPKTLAEGKTFRRRRTPIINTTMYPIMDNLSE